ncbi:DedA family protein [Fictibacillus fluitans]|uniref:DedA family protein n=1 Tax=Fictibacillus fluitans TaxID=3058422 RepID=A0ABT8I208_9BACL|nr:DedA family protein [Fictibacillus sp. NE201]MDN4527014.1 DedA family protein [Fictibacillus sp. NE201]
MNYGFFFQFFQDHGYLGVFFLSWIGLLGLPVPNEFVVMASGMLSNKVQLNPAFSFIATYFGVSSVLTLSYMLGRYGGTAVVRKLYRFHRIRKGMQKGSRLLDQWGERILVLSFFIPGLRLLMPFIVGSNRLPYHRFALLTYPAGFLWAVFYFSIGSQYGEHLTLIQTYFRSYSWILPAGIIIFALPLACRYAKQNKHHLPRLHKHSK